MVFTFWQGRDKSQQKCHFLVKFLSVKFWYRYFANVSIDVGRWLCWDSGRVNSHLGSLFNHLAVSPHFLSGFRNTETGRWVIKLIRFRCRVMIRYQVQTLCGSKHQSLLLTTGTRKQTRRNAELSIAFARTFTHTWMHKTTRSRTKPPRW